MRRTDPPATAVHPAAAVTAFCARMYYADLVPAYAFVFQVSGTGTRFTVYAPAADSHLIGETYALLLTPPDAAPLPLSVEDGEFLRHCLHNTSQRWREAVTEANAGADQPQQPRGAEPGYLNVEPTRAGYRAARQLFTDELERVESLIGRLDRHLDLAQAARPDGRPS